LGSSFFSISFPQTTAHNIASMTEAQEIPIRLAANASQHLGVSSVSTSPTATFYSPGSFGGALTRIATGPTQRELKPFDTTDIKILLLENVNQSGRDILSEQGYQVESLKSSLPEDQLIEKIR
jgi:D-3-phosphoglycerate dehydrogenase